MLLLPAAQGWAPGPRAGHLLSGSISEATWLQRNRSEVTNRKSVFKSSGPLGSPHHGSLDLGGGGGEAVLQWQGTQQEAQGACPVHPEQMAWGTFSDVWPIHDFPGRFLKFLFIPVTTFSRNHIHRESSRRCDFRAQVCIPRG